ncbi:hypothetical protein PFLG_02356 [Plasmodium falciparum RAJ116]|uniref:Uncharacterized protein n=1 Tax=Plasmodium falciparum RAJ116 TaxID=580058 RepID=A0A0L0CXV2_PLAFA|nr:hypothetical protein PFLG_02356 [Plasmodium falciparum RAJ116]
MIYIIHIIINDVDKLYMNIDPMWTNLWGPFMSTLLNVEAKKEHVDTFKNIESHIQITYIS